MAVIDAYLDDYGKITVNVSRIFYNGSVSSFYITGDDGTYHDCVIQGVEDHEREVRYRLIVPANLRFGTQYYIHEQHGQCVPLQVRYIVRTKRFLDEYTYEKDDLGATWHEKYTDFVLWAPTSIHVYVKVTMGDKVSIHPMEKGEHGTWRVRVNGDLSSALYVYILERDGITIESLDPNGLSSNSNSRASAVIDVSKITNIHDPIVRNPVDTAVDAIIYEASVRDMTSSTMTGTKTNGKYISLTESGTKWKVNPTGLDYLASLGVTHVQFQPVNDFATVDEDHPDRSYNWGYDPSQLLCLEGSYATDPNDPYSRMIEFKKMVSTLHSRGLRVNIDVVFNHMYDVSKTAFDRTVPFYYFRYNESNYLSNGSWCGNDLDSRMPMMRKHFLHVIEQMMKIYGVDGFRFDLMGIIDITTMNQIYELARSIKPDAMIYGEGWDMPTALDWSEKSMIYNQHHMQGIGHFNDTFRDVAKGRTSDDSKYDRGYLTGNLSMAFDMCSALTGNTLGEPYFRRFDSPVQSINAMETHDNATVWDKMHFCCNDEPRDVRMRRHKMLIAAVLVAQGVPFIHAGQEFCGSKNDNANSYNAGDEINGMNWDRMVLNHNVLEYTKKAIALRHQWKAFKLPTSQEIAQRVHFSVVDNDVVFYDIDYTERDSDSLRVIMNPSSNGREYHFEGEWKMIFNENGDYIDKNTNHIYVPPYTLIVLAKMQ